MWPRLLDYPGRMEVEANTLTGRALVLHDDALSSDDVATMVRRAAALVTPQNSICRLEVASRPAVERDGPGSRRLGLLVAVGGMAVGALGALVGSPLLSLVGIVGSSLLIIRQGWREAAARQGKTSRRSTRSADTPDRRGAGGGNCTKPPCYQFSPRCCS